MTNLNWPSTNELFNNWYKGDAFIEPAQPAQPDWIKKFNDFCNLLPEADDSVPYSKELYNRIEKIVPEQMIDWMIGDGPGFYDWALRHQTEVEKYVDLVIDTKLEYDKSQEDLKKEDVERMNNNAWLLTQELEGLEEHQSTLRSVNEQLQSSHLQIAIRDIDEAIDSIREVIDECEDADEEAN